MSKCRERRIRPRDTNRPPGAFPSGILQGVFQVQPLVQVTPESDPQGPLTA